MSVKNDRAAFDSSDEIYRDGEVSGYTRIPCLISFYVGAKAALTLEGTELLISALHGVRGEGLHTTYHIAVWLVGARLGQPPRGASSGSG